MITQYALTPDAWTVIGIAGQSGACWLDEDGDGAAGSVDVRIITSATEPVLADATKGKRVFSPGGNTDFCTFSALNETYLTYAICKNPGDKALLSVDDCVGVMMVKAHPYNTELDGALRAQIQDNQAELIGLKAVMHLGNITLSQGYLKGTQSVVLVGGHGVVVGNLVMFEEGGYTFQATALSVATNTIGLDTMLDRDFTTSAVCYRCSDAMNVNGSVTPVVFSVKPPLGSKWDIYGCSMGMLDNTVMDDGTFGGIAALTKGIVLRKMDGVYKNIFNIKINGDFAFRCDEVRYSDKPPSGTFYGINVKKTFANRHGIVIRLDSATNDALELVVQDNLTGLISFKMAAWGHAVT